VQIAHHRALDRRRHLQSRRFYTNEEIDETITCIADPQGSEPAYHSSLEGVLGREEARGLFESLSIDQREVIRLAFYEGHTFAEIAELRRQSFGNVRNHYYRGLEKMRRQIFQGKLRGR
jgi:RNA polymerase sigma-70 factor (ECF subfamily)